MEWEDLTEEYTSALTSSDSLLLSGTIENSSGSVNEPSSTDASAAPDDGGETNRA